MDLRIEKLKEKYWAGETSPAEEMELKDYFNEKPSLTQNGRYFAELKKHRQLKPEHSFIHPGRKKRQTWMSVAATILVLIAVSLFIFQNNNRKQDQFAIEDPQEAFEITRASLMKVSEALNKGKTYSQELNKINKAKEIINN